MLLIWGKVEQVCGRQAKLFKERHTPRAAVSIHLQFTKKTLTSAPAHPKNEVLEMPSDMGGRVSPHKAAAVLMCLWANMQN